MSSIGNIFALEVTAPRLEFDLLWTLIMLFAGLCIAYFISVFFLKRRLTKKEKAAIVLKKDIAPMISTLLFKADDGSREEGEDVVNAKVHVKELLKNPDRRKKISEILIDIRADLPEETRERVTKMYLDFGLHEDAIQKLNSWRWEEVCRGIDELTQMQVSDAYMYIRKFINDSRSIVRKQAQLAMVALKPEGIIYYLDHAKHAISEWQQLKILEILHNLPDYEPPRFPLWLTSPNQHVVLFALRLIRSFNQFDAMESILKLVKHKDDTIKVEAINCIREFGYVAAVPLFQKIFQNCKSEVKLALLHAIGEMGDQRDIPFLKCVEEEADDHIIKSKAISTINALAPETILPSDQINESLASDFLVLEVRDFVDSENASDTAAVDESHENFQEVVNSPEFEAHHEEPSDENPRYELLMEEELKEIRVTPEILVVHGSRNEDENQRESKVNEEKPIKTIADRLGGTGKENRQQGSGRYGNRSHPNHVEHEEEEPVNKEAKTELSATTYQDLFPTDIELSQDEEEMGSRSIQPEPAEHQAEIRPEFKLGLQSYEVDGYDPEYARLLMDLKQGREIRHWKQSDFERIFCHVNEDMKLTLLSDILNYGDARELPLLFKLRKDKSANVRRNAEYTLEELASRLFTNDKQVSDDRPESEDELAFDIDLESGRIQQINGQETPNTEKARSSPSTGAHPIVQHLNTDTDE